MSRSNFILATSALLIAGTVGAMAETITSSEPVGSYHLKRKSSFNAAETARAPFWPIGHVKRAKQGPVEDVAVPVVQRTRLEPDMFAVTSIVLGNPSLAIINGRAYGEGEMLRVPKGAAPATKAAVSLDPRVRVRVMRINDGQVVLQSHDGQSVTVPLKRPELQQRQNNPAEEVLEQDR